jgi:hypothetical protein
MAWCRVLLKDNTCGDNSTIGGSVTAGFELKPPASNLERQEPATRTKPACFHSTTRASENGHDPHQSPAATPTEFARPLHIALLASRLPCHCPARISDYRDPLDDATASSQTGRSARRRSQEASAFTCSSEVLRRARHPGPRRRQNLHQLFYPNLRG